MEIHLKSVFSKTKGRANGYTNKEGSAILGRVSLYISEKSVYGPKNQTP